MLRVLKRARGTRWPGPCLHKSRATFAITCLQGGANLKTVQQWLGHTDLASTMRYLRAAVELGSGEGGGCLVVRA